MKTENQNNKKNGILHFNGISFVVPFILIYYCPLNFFRI